MVNGEIGMAKRDAGCYEVRVRPGWDYGIEPLPAGYVIKVAPGKWRAVLYVLRPNGKRARQPMPVYYPTRKRAVQAITERA